MQNTLEQKQVMYKLIRSIAPVVLVFFFCGLFAGQGWAMTPLFPSSESRPFLMISCPKDVGYNEVFTVKIIFDEGSDGFNGLVSTSEILPKGFTVVRRGDFIQQYILPFMPPNRWYEVDIKAPNRKVDYEKLTFIMNGISGDCNINVRDPMQIKYGFDSNKVPSDYNGNINLAVAVESMPSFVPCGFYVLGQGFREENTFFSESFLSKIIGTIGFFYALTPGESSHIAIGIGAYLGSLLIYDLPNLYKYHEAKLEIAKLKKEDSIK